jgi:hypothetical protein
LDISKLLQLKDKIVNIFYDVTNKNIDTDFIDQVRSFGIKIDFIFHELPDGNKEDLNQKKLDLIEYQEPINVIEYPNKDFNLIKNSTFYRSKKLLFANNNVYLSKAAYLENKPIELNANLDISQQISDIANLDLLIQNDSDYCLFYK